MNYFEKLKQVVLDNSYAKTYAEATTEWVTTYYDTCDSDICVCGKCGLKNRYEITNVKIVMAKMFLRMSRIIILH